MSEEKSYKTLFKHAENIGLSQEQIRIVCEAMDEHSANIKQSRDTWEDIAKNCQEDLKEKINEIQKINSEPFFVVFETDKYGIEPVFGSNDKELLKQKLVEKIRPNLSNYYQDKKYQDIWDMVEKSNEYKIIEIKRA